MLYDWFVNLVLLSFCIVDTKFYKIKNEMIIISIMLVTFYIIMEYGISQSILKNVICKLIFFFIVEVVLFFFSLLIPLSSGDAKLIGLIFFILGVNDGLYTIFFGSLLSLLPLSTKIVRKVPLGLMFYIGYLIHFLIK